MKQALWLFIGIVFTMVSVGGLLLKDDASKLLTLAMFLGGLIIAMTAFIVFIIGRQQKTVRDTQRIISDLDLLRLFEKQAGGLLSNVMVAEKTGLTKKEAHRRLYGLAQGGLLAMGTNASSMNYYYELAAPLEEKPGIFLSGEPYLTIEDLQQIFEAYDYRVSPHDIMVTTGLPWTMISREMQHFRKQGVVDVANIVRPGDSSKQYILLEAYHPSDALDLNSRTRINAEVRQVLYDEDFLV